MGIINRLLSIPNIWTILAFEAAVAVFYIISWYDNCFGKHILGYILAMIINNVYVRFCRSDLFMINYYYIIITLILFDGIMLFRTIKNDFDCGTE